MHSKRSFDEFTIVIKKNFIQCDFVFFLQICILVFRKIMEKNPFKLLTIRTQNTLTTRSIIDYHLDQVEIIENLDHFPRIKLQKKTHTPHARSSI